MKNILPCFKCTFSLIQVIWVSCFIISQTTVAGQTHAINFITSQEHTIVDFCIDRQENCYIVFRNIGAGEPEKVFLAKFNGQLEFEWGRLLSQENVKMKAKSVTTLDNGNVLVLTEDYQTGQDFAGTNIFLIELNAQGDIIKNTRIGNTKYEELSLAKKLSDGRIIMAGNIQNKTNFNALLMEWVNGEWKTNKAFQIGKVDYIDGICEHENKLYMYGRSTYAGPEIKPFLAKLSLDLNIEQVWTFADENFSQYREYVSSINHAHSTNNGLYLVFSRENFSVSFLFENGEILSPPTRHLQGRLANTVEYNEKQYYFDEYYSTISTENDTIVYLTEPGFGFNKIIFFNDKFIVVTENDLPSIYKSSFHDFKGCSLLIDDNWLQTTEHVIKVDSIFHVNLEDPNFFIHSNNDVISESRPVGVTLNCFVSDVSEEKKIPINIYPNPTCDVVEFSTKADYFVYDLHGRKLDSGNQKDQVQMDKYPPGLYMIRVDGLYFKIQKH